MNILHAIILGIIEGVTEFLPISSTGHLILASYVLKLAESDFLKSFEIFIQLGAILAVVVLYWKRILTNFSLMKKLIVAFLPVVVVGLTLYKIVKDYLLGSTQVVLWTLFAGGVIIWAYEKWRAQDSEGSGDKNLKTTLENMTYKQALGIGVAQSVAVVPGVSRAAATILGGLILGVDRKSIVEFSFMLAIPTMAAATGLDLIKSSGSFSSNEWMLLAVGFIISFITAIFAVKWLVRFIQNHDFTGFGIYRIALAVLFWLALIR